MKKKAIGLVASGVTLVAAASIVTAGPADAVVKKCGRSENTCVTGFSFNGAANKKVNLAFKQASCGSGSYCPVAKWELDLPNPYGDKVCGGGVPADGQVHRFSCKLYGAGTYRVLVTNLSRGVTISTGIV